MRHISLIVVVTRSLLCSDENGVMVTADAFTPYWEAFRRDFLPLARRETGSDASAEDAMQETYLRIHPRLERFQFRDATEEGNRKALFGWMHQVLWRVCREVRGRDARFLPVPDVVGGFCPDDADRVLEELTREENRRMLYGLIDAAGLSPMQKRCLLAKMAGYDYPDIARAVGTTPRRLRGHIYVALKKIRAFPGSRERETTV